MQYKQHQSTIGQTVLLRLEATSVVPSHATLQNQLATGLPNMMVSVKSTPIACAAAIRAQPSAHQERPLSIDTAARCCLAVCDLHGSPMHLNMVGIDGTTFVSRTVLNLQVSTFHGEIVAPYSAALAATLATLDTDVARDSQVARHYDAVKTCLHRNHGQAALELKAALSHGNIRAEMQSMICSRINCSLLSETTFFGSTTFMVQSAS